MHARIVSRVSNSKLVLWFINSDFGRNQSVVGWSVAVSVQNNYILDQKASTIQIETLIYHVKLLSPNSSKCRVVLSHILSSHSLGQPCAG